MKTRGSEKFQSQPIASAICAGRHEALSYSMCVENRFTVRPFTLTPTCATPRPLSSMKALADSSGSDDRSTLPTPLGLTTCLYHVMPVFCCISDRSVSLMSKFQAHVPE